MTATTRASIQWAARLMLLSTLGLASEAWANPVSLDDCPAVTYPVAGDPPPGVGAVEALSATAVAPVASEPASSLEPVMGEATCAAVTTAAADLAAPPSFSAFVIAGRSLAQGTADGAELPALEQFNRVEPAAPPSPWRVEFRPYLEVPFSVNGQLRFESVLDLGDIDIAVAGTDVGRLTVTPNAAGSSLAALSQSELAALAAARNSLGGTALPTAPNSRARTIQLTQTRGVELGSVFLLGGELEIWYHDFALALDGFYANLGSRLLFGRAGGTNSSESILELGVDYTRIGAALGWRAGRFPLTSREGVPAAAVFPAVTVDLFGGARYISYGFDFVSTNTQLIYRASPSWIEPIVQTRAEVLFDPRTKLTLNGYVGGFGLGNSPNLSWGGSAGLDWRFLPNVSIRPSYRFASVDWDGDGDIVDLTTHSLWLGVTVYFN